MSCRPPCSIALSIYLTMMFAAPPGRAQVNVLTWHNDTHRSGANLAEVTLTPANVNSTNFGRRFLITADGKVDAQPLYVAGLTIAGAKHNVLFVVTEQDSVYAYDADTGASLWHVSVLGAGESPSDTRGCSQISPTMGVTGTPVINPGFGPHGTIYLVAMSKNSAGQYFQKLHALDLTTGGEQFGGPVTITAKLPGTGDNSSGGYVTFDPAQYKERAALLNLNGVIYISFASHCDNRPYTGWVMGYRAANLQPAGVINLTPNGNMGAIWSLGAMSAAGSEIFLLVANGTFDPTLNANGFPSKGDYGNAFVRLETTNGTLTVGDYFTMSNTVNESTSDVDLGSGGILLLPNLYDPQKVVRYLAVGAGKDGNLYVVDRSSLGKFSPSVNNIYQELSGALTGGIWGSPAWFSPFLYYGPSKGPIKAFRYSAGKFMAQPASQTVRTFAYPGITPTISANNNTNAILWAAENANPSVLRAYDALDLTKELYNTTQAQTPANRDQFGTLSKFAAPMIANGKVYVLTTTGVAVFGLLH